MTTTLIHDPDTHFTGKKDPKPAHAMVHEFVDVERIEPQLPANIINSALNAAAAQGQTIPLAMYLNDGEGDCTIAGLGNAFRVDSDGKIQVTDPDVQTGYVAVTAKENNGQGFDPQTRANDNGCVEVDVLDYATTVGIGGVKLEGHAGVQLDETSLRVALFLFGHLYPGWALSTDQQSQQIWQPGSAAAGSWGGHCAPIFDWYTQPPSGLTIRNVPIPSTIGDLLVLGTWADYKPATSSYVPFACDEAHVFVTQGWIDRNQGNPAIDMPKLVAFLKTLQPES